MKNKAIFLMILSAYSFSALQITVKILDKIPLMKKVLFRNLILLLGTLAAFGQIALTYAYNSSPASEITIYDY